MRQLDPRRAAADAVAPRSERPATAVIFDSADARLVVFRIEPGQSVAPHSNPSTVLLSILEGTGVVQGRDGERHVKAGDLIAYEPGETHAMRAPGERLVILATITPRPGERHT